MKRLIAWLRVISPAEYVFVGLVVGIAALLLIFATFGALVDLYPQIRDSHAPFEWWSLWAIPGVLAQLAALAYGFLRAAYFHPLRRENYLRWLRSTAWEASLPLPLGPLTLCWQDAFWIGVFTLIAALSGYPLAMLGPSLLGLGCYSFLQIGALAAAGPYWAAYAARFAELTVLFVLFRAVVLAVVAYIRQLGGSEPAVGLIPVVVPSALLILALLGLIVVVIQVGLRQQLRRIANDAAPCPVVSKGKQAASAAARRFEARLGWPLYDLNPARSDGGELTDLERTARALLIAWLAALVVAGTQLFQDDHLVALSQHPEQTRLIATRAGAILFFVAIPCAGLRVLMRTARYTPPCNWRARFATGRWLLPYDQILRTPLLLTLAAVVAFGLMLTPLGGVVLAFCLAFLMALLYYFGPPDEETFRLTGHYRLARPTAQTPSEWPPAPPRVHFWD